MQTTALDAASIIEYARSSNIKDDPLVLDLIEMVEILQDAATQSRDLIGNQAGDITGAALDAWAILSDALRSVSDTQRRNGE